MEGLIFSFAIMYISTFIVGIFILFNTGSVNPQSKNSLLYVTLFLLFPVISWAFVYLKNRRKHLQDNIKKTIANSTPVLEDSIKLILPSFNRGMYVEDLKFMSEIEAHILHESLKDAHCYCNDLTLILSILNSITEVDKVVFKVSMLERLAYYREKKRNISEIYTNRPDMIAFLTKPCDSEPFAPLLKHLQSIEKPTLEDLSAIDAITKQLTKLKRKRDKERDDDYYGSY